MKFKSFAVMGITTALSLAAINNSQAGVVTTDSVDIIIKSKGGLEISTVDKQYKFKLGGRMMWDYDSYDFADFGSDEGSSSELRRGRIYVSGVAKKDWHYKFQLEWAAAENGDGSNKVDVEDAYIKYTGLPVYIKGGRFRVPVGLEEFTSSNNATTIERAGFWDAVPTRRNNLSLEVGQTKSDYTWSLGLYENQGGDEAGIRDSSGDLTYSVGGRVTWAPINEAGSTLHLGVSYLAADFDDALQRARLRTRLGVHSAARVTLADAGNTAEDDQLAGLEAAWVTGPFSLQGEYIQYEIGTSSGPDVEFDAWYLQAAYSLTGESRPYGKGKFGKIKPKNDIGAFELVTKYEMAEAELGAVNSEYNIITVGVNWYVNTNVRLALNYLMNTVDQGTEEDGNAISLRSQFVF